MSFKELNILEVFNVQDGFAFPSEVYTIDRSHSTKLIRIQDINNKSSIKEVRIPNSFILANSDRYFVHQGDYLISLSGAAGFHITKWKGEEGYLNQRITKISLKNEYKGMILEDYEMVIFYQIKINLNNQGRGQNNNLSRKDIEKTSIKIPINSLGEFDLVKQKEISQKYQKLLRIKEKVKNLKDDFQNGSVKIDELGNYKEVSINEIFFLKRGKSIFTKQYGEDHKGDYPVYAAGREKLTSIDTFDYEGIYITWATNGFAGYLKKIEGKFSLNSDRGIFIPKDKNIDLDFVRYAIQGDLRNLTKGRIGDKGKNEFTKLSPDKIKDNIFIKIPIDKSGNYDLEKQKKIANKYMKLEQIKENLVQDMLDMVTSDVLLF